MIFIQRYFYGITFLGFGKVIFFFTQRKKKISSHHRRDPVDERKQVFDINFLNVYTQARLKMNAANPLLGHARSKKKRQQQEEKKNISGS